MDRFRSEESFYTNPKPECLCQRETPNVNTSHITRQIRLCRTIFLQNDSYADAVVAHCVPYNLLEQYKLVVVLPLYTQGSGMYFPGVKKAGGRYCKIQMKRTNALGCTAGTDHQRQGLPSTIFLFGVRQVIKKKELHREFIGIPYFVSALLGIKYTFHVCSISFVGIERNKELDFRFFTSQSPFFSSFLALNSLWFRQCCILA